MSQHTFVKDLKSLQQSARKHIENGIISDSYGIEAKKVIKALNTALATERVCVLRYENHHRKAEELGAKDAAEEFLEHAREEAEHADQLAERITQLGGTPITDPDQINEISHADYVECDTVDEMIIENIVAERIAIESYRRLIQSIDNRDPITRKVLESILAKEEEHASDLLDLKAEYEHLA